MKTEAVVLSGPKALSVEELALAAPGESDLVIDIKHSGISTGTEKLFGPVKCRPSPVWGIRWSLDMKRLDKWWKPGRIQVSVPEIMFSCLAQIATQTPLACLADRPVGLCLMPAA